MKKSLKILFLFAMLCFISTFQEGCGNSESSNVSANNNVKNVEINKSENLVTFIDLGSVKCIACKMMEPVIEKLREKYKGKVNVIFYDVWTEQGKPYAYKYRIKMIPTQIILNKNGKEVFRHTGYLPVEEAEKVFAKLGVK